MNSCMSGELTGWIHVTGSQFSRSLKQKQVSRTKAEEWKHCWLCCHAAIVTRWYYHLYDSCTHPENVMLTLPPLQICALLVLSETRRPRVLTRSPPGENESHGVQTNPKEGPRLRHNRSRSSVLSSALTTQSCILQDPLYFLITAQELGRDTTAGSDDLAFLSVFVLQRHNSTWVSSAIRVTRSLNSRAGYQRWANFTVSLSKCTDTFGPLGILLNLFYNTKWTCNYS